MRSVLHFFKCIFLLAWLAFLILSCHSCVMQLSSTMGQPAAAGSEPIAAPVVETLPDPVPADIVQLSSGNYPKDTADLTAVVTADDLTHLDEFTALTSADLSGSFCYAEMLAWANSHPGVAVRYTITLPDGRVIPNDITSIDLSGLTAFTAPQVAALLQYLPSLQSIDLGVAQADSRLSAEDLAAITAASPNATVHYALSLLGREVSLSDTELDLSSITPDQLGEALPVLSSMNNLQMIHLGSEGNGLSWDNLTAIHNAVPAAALDYGFNLWGVDANLSDEYLSFSHIKMNDQGESVRRVVPLMTRLQTLDMDSCDVSNEAMAVIRDENPNVDVIWRIWFARYSVRTDVERILASSVANGGEVNNAEAAKLQYCTKLKYLDLGHNRVLSDISFASSMPDLEVLILAINDVSDISPLADCPKLEYLEINSTNVTDLTPLSNATSLRHLNIGRTARSNENTGEDEARPRVTDLTPLYGLKDLERLWIGYLTAQSIPKEQIDHMAEVMGVEDLYNADGTYYEYCERINVTAGDPSQGTWRTTGSRPDWVWEQWKVTGVFNDPLNERYTLLREQFQYDLGVGAYSLPQNDPLY